MRPNKQKQKLVPQSNEERYFYDEINALIEDGNRALFDGLSPIEQRNVLEIMTGAVKGKRIDEDVLRPLWELDYIRKPVDVITFVTGLEYIGRAMDNLSDVWARDLEAVFDPREEVVEWLMTGSLGAGKTAIASAALCYKLYRLSCLRDPAAYYGLLSGSRIVLGVYSLTLAMTEDTAYYRMQAYVDGSDYFRDVFPRDMARKTQMNFANNTISVQFGSTELHQTGKDLLALCYAADTFVETDRGAVLMKDLADAPARVWTTDGIRAFLTDEPLRSIRTGLKESYTIKFSNEQSVRISPEQPLRVRRGCGDVWVEARDLEVKDLVLGFGNDIDAIRVTEVVEISHCEELEEMYDIPEVPGTHAMFVGQNVDAPFVVGKNCIDEVNFFKAKQDVETMRMVGRAYELYDATRTRMISRFQRRGRQFPGMLFLMSSKQSEKSFLEQKLRKFKKNYKDGEGGFLGERREAYVSSYALWEAKPPGTFGKLNVRVQVGDRINPSRVLGDDEKPRDGVRIILVPELLRPSFEEDTDHALRNLAGVATTNVSPLIGRGGAIMDCVNPRMKHPFNVDVLSLSEHDKIGIQTYFNIHTACRLVNSQWRPKLSPHNARYIHVDGSLSGDATGIAMVHRSGAMAVKRLQKDGTYAVFDESVVVLDFALRIAPKKSEQIPLPKIVDFIQFLSRIYNIRAITYDGYQSAYAIQVLRLSKFNAGLLSMDRTSDPYLLFRDSIYARTFVMYEYKPLIDELFDLQYHISENKVDHLDDGKKDCADATAGAHWLAKHDETPEVDNAIQREADLPTNAPAAIRTNPDDQKWAKLEAEAEKG